MMRSNLASLLAVGVALTACSTEGSNLPEVEPPTENILINQDLPCADGTRLQLGIKLEDGATVYAWRILEDSSDEDVVQWEPFSIGLDGLREEVAVRDSCTG
jgi:hypothetical protein